MSEDTYNDTITIEMAYLENSPEQHFSLPLPTSSLSPKKETPGKPLFLCGLPGKKITSVDLSTEVL